MGIFYQSGPAPSGGHVAMRRRAVAAAPGAGVDQITGILDKEQIGGRLDTFEMPGQASGRFSWGRLALAVGLLFGVLVACMYAAQHDKLQELYKILLHSFELLLGAVIGLLTGETASRK